MMRIALALLVALVLPLALVPGVSARALDEQIVSKALQGTVHARVVLPDGYASSGKRYPVVYFLHGLPAGPDAYDESRWLGRTLRQLHREAILVEPQGARAGDSDPEYLDWGSGRNWETYVAQELPRWVDAHFRTITTRAGRGIIGLSAGGYGASLVGFDHPERFAVVESWSGYFHPTDPTGHRTLDRGSDAKNAQADVHYLAAADARAGTLPVFFGFYVGSRDTRFRAENAQLNRELNAEHVPHAFTVYPGAHTTALWQAHAAEWLRMALKHLTPAR